MSAEEFLALLKKYPSVEAGDLTQLAKLRAAHKYCQIVPILIARGLQDSRSPVATQAINQAAVITSDRSLLRTLMTIEAAAFSAIKELETVVPVIEGDDQPQIESTPQASQPVSTPQPTHAEVKKEEVKPIIEAVQKPAINTSKTERVSVAQTENTVSETKNVVDSVIAESIETDKEPDAGFAADTVMAHLATLQSNKQKFNTLAEQVEEYLQQSGKHQTIAGKKIEVKEGDQLIKEIKSSKKKQKSDAPQHTEQAAIIDQFIQARLEPIRIDKSTIKQDLTATSETYSENVISETLVDILLRQGKKEKALEVLRKLIWKFPQKKALFAARIEELSK